MMKVDGFKFTSVLQSALNFKNMYVRCATVEIVDSKVWMCWKEGNQCIQFLTWFPINLFHPSICVYS